MDNKEIYLITAYTPTKKQEDILRNLVITLNSQSKKICLISHSHIPSDIVKRVNYYFFDEENKLDLDSRFRWKHYNDNRTYRIESRLLLPSKISFFPVMRLCWFGVKICKFLGYNVVHQLEYDSQINNFYELDINKELMSEYNCIVYSNKRDSKNFSIQGSYVCINPQEIPDNFFTYDEQQLLDNFSPYKLKVENFNFDYYYSKLNFIKKPIEDLEQSLTLDINNTDTPNGLYFTLLYNPNINSDEEWFWYSYSSFKDREVYRDFELVINDKIIPLKVARWAMGGIKKDKELHTVKFIYQNKIVNSFDMKDPQTIKDLQTLNLLKKK